MPHFVKIATPLALAILIAGCGQKAQDNTNSAMADVTTVADDSGNAIANAADAVKEAVTPTPTAQEFVNTAAKSDAFEIEAAKIARDKATSADLKSFAAMMIDDHTASTARIKMAAGEAKPAIVPDPTLTSDQNDKLAELRSKSGKDFDEEYAEQQVDAHQSALSLMTNYGDNGDVASLKAAAAEIKPKVATHLDKIKAIKDKL